MRERERLLWNVLIILLLIVAGYEGYNVYRMGQQVRTYQAALAHESLGSSDPQLSETVSVLENELQERLNYEFSIKHDPLDLTQVIHGRRFLAQLGFQESIESQTKMRLSCTVMSEKPAAVIKFQGRSHVLRIGDDLGGYRLAEVRAEHCVLTRAGERLTLATEKSPESMDQDKNLKDNPVTVSPSDTTAPQGTNF
jgi:type II secretory pathway component PulC